MTSHPEQGPMWRRCTVADAEVLAGMNRQLSQDEGAAVGEPSAYLKRMTTWLQDGRYEAAIAESGTEPRAYVVWRHDPDYGDVFIRQYFVVRTHRGQGLGRLLFERAAYEFWRGHTLRLDVYDSNPGGGAFWESLGFTPYSRLLRRQPASSD